MAALPVPYRNHGRTFASRFRAFRFEKVYRDIRQIIIKKVPHRIKQFTHMTKTIASATDTNKKYFLTIDEQTGHATACQCPDRQHRSWKPSCKHMDAFNAEVNKAATFLLLRVNFGIPWAESVQLCGRGRTRPFREEEPCFGFASASREM